MNILQLKNIHKRKCDKLKILSKRQTSGLDEKGNRIPDIYYKVVLDVPLADEKYDGLFKWLDLNIKKDRYIRYWVTDFYFKYEEDAMAFKLCWT